MVTDALNAPLSIMTKTLGMQSMGESLETGIGSAGELLAMEGQPTPPSIEDANKAARKSNMMKKSTYGLTGTIRNTGGAKGVASSLLNLSSRSLVGK